MSDAFWIILAGSLVGACCGLLGCFLLLRKMTMVGDAISHAVLPGIVVAYLIARTNASFVMLIGAALVGMLATIMIEGLHKSGRLQMDASIGIAYTWLFALGIIMISFYGGNVDLDQECVLYGEIAYVPLDTWLVGELDLGPVTVWRLLVNLVIVLGLVVLGYKGLFITSFDPIMAASLGISTAFWHYALMAAVSLTTVFSFEAVGAILVVAFLTAPAAIAYLLTDSLPRMLLLSVLAGITSAIGGYFLALWLDASIGGAMAVMAGLEFMIAFAYARIRNWLQSRYKETEPVIA